MQHQAPRREYAVRLAQDPPDPAPRNLVQEHRGEHEVETRVGKIQPLGVHLPEMDRPPLRARPGERVAQAGRGDVDRMHFGIRKRVLPGAGVVTDRAAEIEDALRPESRVAQLHVACDRGPDVVEIRTHQTHRGDGEPVVIGRAGREIVRPLLGRIAPRHQMHVDRTHRPRHLEAGFEREGPERRAAREFRGAVDERAALTFDRRRHDLVDEVLARDPESRIEPEVFPGLERGMDLLAAARRPSAAGLELRGHGLLEQPAQAPRHVVVDILPQRADEACPRFLIPGLPES